MSQITKGKVLDAAELFYDSDTGKLNYLVSRSPSLFTVRAAQARTSRRSPRSTYDPVSLPRRPCVSAQSAARRRHART